MLSRFVSKLTAFLTTTLFKRPPDPEADIEARLDYLRDLKIRWAAYMFLHITPRGTKIAGGIGENTNTLYTWTHSEDWAIALKALGHQHHNTQQPVSYSQWREKHRYRHKKEGTQFPGFEYYERLWRERKREELLQKEADDLVHIPEPIVETGAGSLGRAEEEWGRMLTGQPLTLDLRGDTTGFEEVQSHD